MPVCFQAGIAFQEEEVTVPGIIPAHIHVVPGSVQKNLVPCVTLSGCRSDHHIAVDAEIPQYPLVSVGITVADDLPPLHKAQQTVGFKLRVLIVFGVVVGGQTAEQVMGAFGPRIVGIQFFQRREVLRFKLA